MEKSKLSYEEKCQIVTEIIGIHPKYLIPCGMKYRLDHEAIHMDGLVLPPELPEIKKASK